MVAIGTFTVNPAVDVHGSVDRVVAGRKLRVCDVRRDPGGGGINVARALVALGGEATAIFLAGGPAGDLLCELLRDAGVHTAPIPIEGPTRENLTVRESDEEERYRFTMPGPAPSESELAAARETVVEHLDDLDLLVISGSLPEGCPDGLDAELVTAAHERDVRTIVDTSGSALEHAIAAGPFLVKPNLRELRDLTGRELEDDAEIVDAARSVVREHDVQAVVVSIGAGGAILTTADHDERIPAPTTPVRSRIGAGDSMVAGMARGLARGESLRDAVRRGVAAGAAAVITPGSELCRGDDADRLCESMREAEAS